MDGLELGSRWYMCLVLFANPNNVLVVLFVQLVQKCRQVGLEVCDIASDLTLALLTLLLLAGSG